MGCGNPKEVTRFIFLDLIDSDINQQITSDPLILPILDCLVHCSLKAGIIRLLPYLMTIFSHDSGGSSRIVIKIPNIKTRCSRELTKPVFWCLSSATNEERTHRSCENTFIHCYSLTSDEFRFNAAQHARLRNGGEAAM